MIDLTHRVVIVTGGSRGIGAATAVMMARAGADVVITYHSNKKAAQIIKKQIESLGKCAITIPGKIENLQDCKRIAELTYVRFHKIDILVNSAGIWEEGAVGTMTEDDWNRSIRVNLTGTFNMCTAVVPFMLKKKYGRIINISSTAGQRGEAFHSHYAASKGGVIAFTKSIAVELIKNGVWVNCVAPGWVDTEMVAHVLKNRKMKKEINNSIPRGQIASVEEIAGPVLFLASDLSNNVVGEVLNVNGGGVLCG